MLNSKFKNICMTGNFRINGNIQFISGVPDINNDSNVIKKDSALYVVGGVYEYELIPLDEDANQVVLNFDEGRGDNNHSIFDLYVKGNNVIIMLYVFKYSMELTISSPMYIYLDRIESNRLEREQFFKSGNEIQFLNNEFYIKNSIILTEYKSGQAVKVFEMYGPNCRANVERERPGIYKITSINYYKTNNRQENLVQFYGNIKFLTFDQAISTKSQKEDIKMPKTHAIFKAWQEFNDFEYKIFENDVISLGYAHYIGYHYDYEDIVFEFDTPLSEISLFNTPLSAEQEYDVLYDFIGDNPTITDLVAHREKNPVINLFKPKNDNFEGYELRFERPDVEKKIEHTGYIILSNRNILHQMKRRNSMARTIELQMNPTTNMILRLSAGEKDSQKGSKIPFINSESKKAMFGDKDVEMTENFKEALNIAINTPDIALIQGPPGTGKTTLINGIVTRLRSLNNKHYKILISSEQHDALEHVIEKLTKEMPPVVTSTRYNDDDNDDIEEKFNTLVTNYQNSFIKACDDILAEQPEDANYSESIASIIMSINKIKDDNYYIDTINEELDKIIALSMRIGVFKDISPIIQTIKYKINNVNYTRDNSGDINIEFIKNKIGKLILDEDGFYSDDGLIEFDSLQRCLDRFGYGQYKIALEQYENLKNHKEFDAYINYVHDLKERFTPSINEFEINSTDLASMFDGLIKVLNNSEQQRNKNFYEIIDAMKFKISGLDTIKNIVMKYSSIVGSTCAQSNKSLDYTSLNVNKKYDYVIIDEAARANPLDLMIPIALGTKVVLVGDQMQLPHYIESKYVKKFKEEKEKYQSFDETLLTKSLFEIIYESLEKSWDEGKLAFKRHIRIQEQHRMHPVIGNFISKQFYTKSIERNGVTEEYGGIKNGKYTINFLNDFDVYDNKNIAWENVPTLEGLEARYNKSLYRTCEANKVVSILKELFRKNPMRDFTVGIISYYKGQVDLINKLVDESFSTEIKEQIKVNTVDSAQGQEFDVVILSTTRANTYEEMDKSLGFISYSQSRVNVSLSRARRLMIVVGDVDTMCKNDIFANLLDYTKENGCYRG